MSEDRVRGSAQDVTYRWLKQHIATLPREAGSFLTESEVAGATGMSRTPVREALLRLETEGLLRIVPKKGAFVPPISNDDIRAVLQARALLEDWCARRVVPASPDFLTRLEELVAEQRALVNDPMAFIVCDRAFHRAIVEQAGNAVLAGFYESLRDRQIRMGVRAVASARDRADVVLSEHSAIVAALRSGDPDAAADAHIAHLRSTLAALGLSGSGGF